jgi:hypothetical protein
VTGSLPVASRVAMTVPAGTARTLTCRLDDWPLLLLDLDADRLWVNDLRASSAYSHVARLRELIRPNEAVSCEAGADDGSALIIVGTLLIAVHVDPTDATCAEVQAIQWAPAASARGTLLDCRVRYRQLPAADLPACSLSTARR